MEEKDMKTKEQIESMIADIEVYCYEAGIKLDEYEKGYTHALKWVIKE